jgi:hypothetical protein
MFLNSRTMIGFSEKNPQESTYKLLGATVGVILKEEIMLHLPDNKAKIIPTQLFCTAFIFIMQ